MSRQQSRSPGDGAIDPSLVQKKRARHRLVGAICLCLLAAVVVPLVLESEPQPSRDLPLELAAAPGSSATQSATQPASPAPSRGEAGRASASGAIAPPAEGASGSLSAVTTVTSPAGDEPVQPPVALAPPASAKPQANTKSDGGRDASKAAPQAPRTTTQAATTGGSATAAGTASKEPSRPAKADEGPDVIARLIERADGKSTTTAAAAAQRKFLVQIGAYSNVQSARNMSDRAVQAGLRPYQETVKTAQGDWIRVRVGPFPTRQDAERAQQDLKRAGVTAAIIAL